MLFAAPDLSDQMHFDLGMFQLWRDRSTAGHGRAKSVVGPDLKYTQRYLCMLRRNNHF